MPTRLERPKRESATLLDESSWRAWARAALAVLVSLSLHFGGSFALWKIAGDEPASRPPIMIEWLEPSQLADKDWSTTKNQVVRKTEVAKEELDLSTAKPKRRFLSEERQDVKKETRAAASGMTENRLGLDPVEESADSRSRASAAQSRTEARAQNRTAGRAGKKLNFLPESPLRNIEGDIDVGQMKPSEDEKNRGDSRELALPFDPRKSGMSTNGEQLPQDIEVGNFTALNTDRFRYYSFYARIEEQIRHRWVKYVKASIYSGRLDSANPQQKSFTTKIEIILDRRGDFQRAIIHDPSGSKALDAAPILAFREAVRIPHPPREMVKEDGTIRLYYAFNVDQIPQVAAKRSRDLETE